MYLTERVGGIMCNCTGNCLAPYETKCGYMSFLAGFLMALNPFMPGNPAGLLLSCCPLDGDAFMVQDEDDNWHYLLPYAERRYTRSCPYIAECVDACDDRSRCCWGWAETDKEKTFEWVLEERT